MFVTLKNILTFVMNLRQKHRKAKCLLNKHWSLEIHPTIYLTENFTRYQTWQSLFVNWRVSSLFWRKSMQEGATFLHTRMAWRSYYILKFWQQSFWLLNFPTCMLCFFLCSDKLKSHADKPGCKVCKYNKQQTVRQTLSLLSNHITFG